VVAVTQTLVQQIIGEYLVEAAEELHQKAVVPQVAVAAACLQLMVLRVAQVEMEFLAARVLLVMVLVLQQIQVEQVAMA